MRLGGAHGSDRPPLERPNERTIIPPPPGHIVPSVSHARSTLLTTSLESLRRRRLLARYFDHLPSELHDDIRTLIAGTWIDLPLVTAHYRACDALKLAPHDVFTIGMEVGRHLQTTFLGTIVKLAQTAGATPWTFIERYDRLLHRFCIGGAVSVYKLGPKEARAEIHANPLFAIPYFRIAFRGVNQSCAELSCKRAYVNETKAMVGSGYAIRLSWT